MKILNENEINYENLINTLNLQNKKNISDLNILVFGVGGSGVNTLNNFDMSKFNHIKLVVASSNTNKLDKSKLESKIFLGKKRDGEITKINAGFDPSVGKILAEENIEEIEKNLKGNDLLIIVGGMSGGTATGAIPVILKKAKELNILTIAIITKPFSTEGNIRKDLAEEGIEKIQKFANILIIYNNEDLINKTKNKETQNLLLELDIVICDIVNKIISVIHNNK